MAYAKRVQPDPIRSLAYGSISGSYAAVGTPLEKPARLVKFSNSTNVPVFISWDGVNNHMYIGPNGFTLLDIATNRVRDDGFFIVQGTQFYVASVSGSASSGGVYIEVYVGY